MSASESILSLHNDYDIDFRNDCDKNYRRGNFFNPKSFQQNAPSQTSGSGSKPPVNCQNYHFSNQPGVPENRRKCIFWRIRPLSNISSHISQPVSEKDGFLCRERNASCTFRQQRKQCAIQRTES